VGRRSLVAASMILAAASWAAPSKEVPHFSLADTSGATHTDAEWKGPAVVLFFLTTDCPISNGYVPEMNRIAKEYAARGVRTYGVMTDTSVPLSDLRKHVKDFAYAFPVLIDPAQILVKYTSADTNPEGVVITPRAGIVYMGRIDNKVENFGQQRQQATEHELRDALDAALAGKRAAKAFAQPIGCSIIRVN
jgi:peroxiredoxin